MKLKRLDRQFKNSTYSIFTHWKRSLVVILIFSLLLLFTPFILKTLFTQSYANKIFEEASDSPEVRVALVLGAGLNGNAEPSPILEDRILKAVELYENGKIERIIMSGDNRTADYDEPSAMIEYAVKNGVPREVLQPDYAGRRTYDSCLRAREVFSLDELIIITQSFHMARAMYICNSIGIDTYGVVADQRHYKEVLGYAVRDTYAFILAIWDVNIGKPEVVLGDKIVI